VGRTTVVLVSGETRWKVRFVSRILLDGVNPYVPVDEERATALRPHWRRPIPVLVRINAGPITPWRTNLMPKGDGSFWLYLHGPMRRVANVGVGDEVTVEMSSDDAYHSDPTHSMPEWFKVALAGDPLARQNWTRLPPSRRKEVERYLGALKTPSARERNLQRALKVLRGEEGRFLGRDWAGGR